ncbi:LCP family protein [Actinobaculum suis]|uniref:LCP family protein n=1 Tax=Actinobaculum suis TaxID=1657 RepID=UPI000B2621AC|nr:LCP family protein [Actinobaculum suis]
MNQQPPSFEPKRRRPRPNQAGAQRVARGGAAANSGAANAGGNPGASRAARREELRRRQEKLAREQLPDPRGQQAPSPRAEWRPSAQMEENLTAAGQRAGAPRRPAGQVRRTSIMGSENNANATPGNIYGDPEFFGDAYAPSRRGSAQPGEDASAGLSQADARAAGKRYAGSQPPAFLPGGQAARRADDAAAQRAGGPGEHGWPGAGPGASFSSHPRASQNAGVGANSAGRYGGGYGAGYSGGPSAGSGAGSSVGTPGAAAARRRPHWGRRVLLVFLLVIALVVAWVAYLYVYGSGKMNHVAALSNSGNTPGTTYLIVGSDAREGDSDVDGAGAVGAISGHRADTIMILHVPTSGTTSLISLPRDSYVEIPGHGHGKLNSSFALGEEPLLVATVENLTGLNIDHYIQVSMGGVANLVDAVGGVNLCYDADVSDVDSGMEWTAGCHDVDGSTALAFSRMRKSDPLGDIGRTNRQRQVISKLISKAASASTLVNPQRQRDLVGAAASALTTDEDSSLLDLGRAGLSLRSVLGESGVSGVPPIADLNYRANGQSNVLLDPQRTPEFFEKVRQGTITQAEAIGIDIQP